MAATLPAPLDVKLMNWTASALFVGLDQGGRHARLTGQGHAREASRFPVFSQSLHLHTLFYGLPSDTSISLRVQGSGRDSRDFSRG